MKSSQRTMDRLTMQRRHFQFIADVIKGLDLQSVDEGAAPDGTDSVTLRHSIAQEFSRALRGTNINFDAGAFLRACDPDAK